MVLTDDTVAPYLFVISAKQLAIYPKTPSRKEEEKKKKILKTHRTQWMSPLSLLMR